MRYIQDLPAEQRQHTLVKSSVIPSLN